MALQQTSRTLLQACLNSKHALAPLGILNTQQQHFLAASGILSAALVLNQHAAAVARQQLAGGLRGFADAPAPSDPMIIPLRQQPAVQQSQPAGPPDNNRGPWEKVEDQASGGAYWWNTRTGRSQA